MAGFAIEVARVRILFATVSKFGHFSSLHDASTHSAAYPEINVLSLKKKPDDGPFIYRNTSKTSYVAIACNYVCS